MLLFPGSGPQQVRADKPGLLSQKLGEQQGINLLAVQIPAVRNGFRLCVGRNCKFQVDEAGAVFYDLAPYFIFFLCIEVLV